MFKLLVDNNYYQQLQKDAIPYIKEDRDRFNDIHDYILDYSTKNNMLISNIKLLLGKFEYWDIIDLSALNNLDVAKTLTMELCKKFNKDFLLKVIRDNEEYMIEYDLRRICNIKHIKPYKDMTLDDFVSPQMYKFNTHNIKLIPPILEIIGLYSILYDVNNSNSWEETYGMINILEKKYVNNQLEQFISSDKNNLLKLFTSSNNSLKGRKQINKNLEIQKKHKKCIKCNIKKNREIINIKTLLLEFIADSNMLLVNKIAYLISTSDNEINIDDINLIEVISSRTIEENFNEIIKFISNSMTVGLIYKEKSIYVPKESRLKKYSIYLTFKDNSKMHIMNIYNNTTYELISYNEIKKNNLTYKIADPIVQCKFIYLLIWSSTIAQKIHGLDFENFQNFMSDKVIILKYYRKQIDIYERKDKYLGVYIDEITYKKMLTITSNINTKYTYYCFDFGV